MATAVSDIRFEKPTVVVPRENPDKASFDDLRLGQIEDRAGRIVVEVDRNEWLVVGVAHPSESR